MSDDRSIPRHWRAVQDHSREWRRFRFVYPVISRRSGGLSIGINLNPDRRCNFDCVYCEVDRNAPIRATAPDPAVIRAELTVVIRSALTGWLAMDERFQDTPALTRRIRDLAFSGDGEPTLLPDFSTYAALVADVRREEELDDTRLVLITNAAGLDKADVKRGLEILDANHGEIWAKLDAGTEDYYRLVNRSHVRFERILRNLRETACRHPLIIQSLFLKTHGASMPEAELAAYCDRLEEITAGGGQIREVHAYTIARPTPEPWATRLEPDELAAIAARIRERTGLTVREFC